MSTPMGKYCYVVIHEDGRRYFWGNDASSIKRLSIRGLPEAVKINRTNGGTSTVSLKPKSRYFVITNLSREKAGLSLDDWIKNCEIDYRLKGFEL